MDDINKFHIGPLVKSKYIEPKSLHYTQNGKKKVYDCVTEHSDVCVLLFNKIKGVFIFVKQFRPAVYLYNIKAKAADGQTDTAKLHPGSLGVTIELCAGLVDKTGQTLEEIAQAEVLEECGYDVPIQSLQKITSLCNNPGPTGSKITIYYCEVTDQQKIGKGGGLVEEGELIEVVELTVSQARELIYDETINRDATLLFALMWFFDTFRH